MLVLSVEDDFGIRTVLARQFAALKARGQKVEFEAVDNLADGLARNAALRPDVVLLDLTLNDGHDAEHTAASIPQFDGTPPPAVVIVTANERPEILLACFRHGADCYFSKYDLRNADGLFAAVLNASLRREHTPGYARARL